MKLVTVTCNKDFKQLILLAESVSLFVDDPIEHVVIVNEDDVNLIDWYKHLKKYYTKHTITLLNKFDYDYQSLLIPRDLNYDSVSGWYTQQLQKLLIAYFIDDDYVVIDSKNFFIRNCNLSQWDNVVGNFITYLKYDPNIDLRWDLTNKYYAEFFNTDPIYEMPSFTTPFKINRNLITEATQFTFDTLGKCVFYPLLKREDIKLYVSEFIFYNYLCHVNNIEFICKDAPRIMGIWFEDKYTNPQILLAKIIEMFHKNQNVTLASIHRHVLNSPEMMNNSIDFVKILNLNLEYLGFENKF